MSSTGDLLASVIGSSSTLTITSSVPTSFGNETSLPVDSVLSAPTSVSAILPACCNTPKTSTAGMPSATTTSHAGIDTVFRAI